MPLAVQASGHESLNAGIQYHLRYSVGNSSGPVSKQDILQALGYTFDEGEKRDRMRAAGVSHHNQPSAADSANSSFERIESVRSARITRSCAGLLKILTCSSRRARR